MGEKKIMKKKIGLVLLFAFTLLLISSNVRAFDPEEMQGLDFFDSLRMTKLEISGEERGCSDDYDSKGFFTGKTYIDCEGQEALLQIYRINKDGGWDYIGEYAAPGTFSYEGQMGYQCYYCPDFPERCSDGERKCYTSTIARVCKNGEWTDEECTGDDVCSQGICGEFGSCNKEGWKVCTSMYGGHTCKNGEYVQWTCAPGEACDYQTAECRKLQNIDEDTGSIVDKCSAIGESCTFTPCCEKGITAYCDDGGFWGGAECRPIEEAEREDKSSCSEDGEPCTFTACCQGLYCETGGTFERAKCRPLVESTTGWHLAEELGSFLVWFVPAVVILVIILFIVRAYKG